MKRVLFVAPFNPLSNRPKDGLLRRVEEIDHLLEQNKYQKDYLVVSARRNIIGRAISCGASNIFYYNRFMHQRAIRELAKHYDLLYVHSIYQARQIIGLYTDPVTRIYTDMHGAAPEELQMYGCLSRRITEYNKIEATVVNCSEKMVFVTNTMRKHFEHKYKKDLCSSALIIPSLYRYNEPIKPPQEHSGLRARMGIPESASIVVYCGGIAKWQNIDVMLEIIQASMVNKQLAFVLLTDKPKELGRLVRQSNISGNRVFLDSVSPSALAPYYEMAQAGFILRDDNIVNRVACPTKLVEYIAHGLYPIVKSSHIGDFLDQGFEYVAADSISNDLDGFLYRVGRHSAVNRNIYEKHYRPELYGNFVV